jgi:hypothetical protein
MSSVRRSHARNGLSLSALVLVIALLSAGAAFAQQPTYSTSIACPPETTPDAGFEDGDGVHAAGIDCLAHHGITQGRTETHYGASAAVTRGQTASLLMGVYGELDDVAEPTRDTTAFSDLEGSVHRSNIERLAGFDPPVVAGYADGTYRPAEAIRRDQFATVIVRFIDQIAAQSAAIDPLPAAPEGRFADVPAANVHSSNVNRLAQAGIISGRTATTYDPAAAIDRAQTATIVARVLGGMVDAGLADTREVTVTGIVHDATDTRPGEYGPPLAGVTVAVQNGAAYTVTTDAEGRYTVTLGEDTVYTLTVDAPGFRTYQQTVEATEPMTVDFGMYPPAAVPDESLPTTSTAADVSLVPGFWRVPVVVAGVERSPEEASDIVLERPDGVVIRLGAAGTDASYWSRTGECSSERTGNQVGDHVVYYRFDGTWYDLTATFGAEGALTHVNGVPYLACTPN